MIKRTIVISRRGYIFHKDEQLHIRMYQREGSIQQGEIERRDGEPRGVSEEEATVPIEDIGLVIIESHQATVTASAINALMENNCVVIGCDAKHLPNSVMYPIASNTLHTAVLKTQLKASVPLMKQLWQQTVKAKLWNQAAVLRSRGINVKPMELWAKKVRSGDQGNLEGRGAAYYWRHFPVSSTGDKGGEVERFMRDPEGEGPNGALNYGYAIIRAAMARAIVGSGLHPSVGLHHSNQYNPFCLADDLMEPYRPFVDSVILHLCDEYGGHIEVTPETKKILLSILSVDTVTEGERKPLMLSMTSTTASLVRCFGGESRKLVYPEVGGIVPDGTGDDRNSTPYGESTGED